MLLMVDDTRRVIDEYYLPNLMYVPTFGPKSYVDNYGTTERVSI